MDDVTERPVAERVRTVLARGAGGTIEAGLLTRPLRSARVRDDGVIVLVVDVGGATRGPGASAGVAGAGAAATIEIVDTVCTGRCREAPGRPSFAVDGRPSAGEANRPCDDECAVTRGIVTISGIVTASSPARRRRLVATDGGGMGPAGESGSLQLSELQPLEVTYLSADGVDVVPRGELSAVDVDPIGVDEQAWLRRLGSETGLAARLALRADRQIAGTRPWIVGVDRFGLDLSIGPSSAGRGEVVRLSFVQVCADSEDVRREVETLAAPS